MDLIVTHTAADFDALSSLVAARKLYPGARMLLPGSQEKNVREFLSLSRDLIDLESDKTCRLDDVKRVVLVDTRHKSRIGKAAEIIGKSGVEVVIYDHHPRTKYDIRPTKDVYHKVGATVTMLLDAIREKGIRLTPLEATLMALGIYEETGSLTYRTTSKKDVDAVSYLISSGANLGIVSSFLNRELSEDELSTLSTLIKSTEVFPVNGVNIAITVIRSERYLSELGMLVQKLLDVENFKVIFVLVEMEKKVLMLARSRMPLVDVNGIVKVFGGGGHIAAASANIRNRPLEDIKSELFSMLKKRVKAKLYARDCMVRRLSRIKPDVRIKDVYGRLESSMAGALLVMKGEKLLGVLTRESAKKAFSHGLGHSRVKGYMLTRLHRVKEGTHLDELRRIIYEEGVGFLPVVKRGRVTGLVTRTAILNTLFEKSLKRAKPLRKKSKLPKAGPTKVNILPRMKRMLPGEVLSIIKRVAKVAEEHQLKAYVVGGFVRDLLLGEKNLDVDLVVEGDAIDFARHTAEKLDATVVAHKKFGTATLIVKRPIKGTRFKIDIAAARTETYKHPAALPSVEFGSIKDDLYRRDFTINAMAASMDMKNFGELIDFFNGRRDLKRKRISVLHDKSFIDDPTRIFRAVRFEQRYDFRIDRRTVAFIRNAVKQEMFEAVSGERLREEIELLLKEKEAVKAIRRMRNLHELRFISAGIRFDRASDALCGSIKRLHRRFGRYFSKKRSVDIWLVYFMVIIDRLGLKATMEVCSRFAMKRSDRLRLVSCKKSEKKVKRVLTDKKHVKPSRIYDVLEPLPYETLLFLMAKCGRHLNGRRVVNFLTRYNGIRLRIRGEDLKDMGMTPGPEFTRVLRKTLYARLDGKLGTRREELGFARELASRQSGTKTSKVM